MDITENELLESIVASLPPPYDPTIHVTAKALAERAGIDASNALEQLNKRVRSGELVKITVRLPTGYSCVAFRRA